MERGESRLFAPYKALGGVCSSVAPAFRTLPTKRRITSVLCALDNVVVQYSAERLRLVSISDVLPSDIGCLAADKRYVYAAVENRIALLHLSRQVERWIDAENEVKLMLPFGEVLIAIDVRSSLHVFENSSGEKVLQIDCPDEFAITAVTHPATYLNKMLLGSSEGRLRLVNVKTGKLVHEFETSFGSKINVLVQTPAVDVVAIGLVSGEIILHNIKFDKTVATFRQDSSVTAITFRSDGDETMITASETGALAIWDLNKKSLIGQMPDAHADCVTGLHCFVNEPLMVSSGADNVLKTWIFDMGDGMPRQLVLLEGHSKPITTAKFCGNDNVLSAGLDGSIRSFSVKRDTQRQKLGNAGIMSRAKAKRIGRDLESISLDSVDELAIGFAREAAWDNIVCRHRNTAVATTWTSRNQSLGKHRLLHKRFLVDPTLVNTVATALCVTACGNFVVIGYSTGHIDCFNIQSGKHRKTFVQNQEKETAHGSPVCGLSVDPLDKMMISAEEAGLLRFWYFANCKLVGELRVPAPVVQFSMNNSSSLLAIGVGNGSFGIVDALCRRVVRIVKRAHEAKFTALEFSPDSKWLLSADNAGLIKVWNLVTNSLIDVIECKHYCTSASFSNSGAYLATSHDGQRSVYLWANKALFGTAVNIVAFPVDYLPSTSSSLPSARMEENTEDAALEVTVEDETKDRKANFEHSDLIVLSGLSTPRWANLPDLDIIRERNKPIGPPKKPKAAPFFLSAMPTLDGFEFEKMDLGDDEKERKAIMAKRSVLEIESSFTRSLLQATTNEEYTAVFESLKAMNISSIDFHIRALPSRALPSFLRMLLLVLRSRKDYELVQAYLATCLKVHRDKLWARGEDAVELDSLLNDLLTESKGAWASLDSLIKENLSIIKWTKSALL